MHRHVKRVHRGRQGACMPSKRLHRQRLG
jgi:hypothetical protein